MLGLSKLHHIPKKSKSIKNLNIQEILQIKDLELIGQKDVFTHARLRKPPHLHNTVLIPVVVWSEV